MSFHVLAKFIVVYAEMLQLLGDSLPGLHPWTLLGNSVSQTP